MDRLTGQHLCVYKFCTFPFISCFGLVQWVVWLDPRENAFPSPTQQLRTEESNADDRNLGQELFREIKQRASVKTKNRSKDGRYSSKTTDQLSWRRYTSFFFEKHKPEIKCCSTCYTKPSSFITHVIRHHQTLLQGELLSNQGSKASAHLILLVNKTSTTLQLLLLGPTIVQQPKCCFCRLFFVKR